MADNPAPSDPNKGFPNPHSADFAGERTPAEELEYQRQQLARDVEAGKVDPATGQSTTSAPDDPSADQPAPDPATNEGQPSTGV